MSFTVIRSPEFADWQMFSAKLAAEIGLEKALVFYNIDRLRWVSSGELEDLFPYLSSSKIHQIVKELNDEGHIRQSNGYWEPVYES